MAVIKYKKNAHYHNLIDLYGRFSAEEDIDEFASGGEGITLSYVSAGRYRLTLDDSINAVGGLVATLEWSNPNAVASAIYNVHSESYNSTNKTFDIITWSTTQDNEANLVSGIVNFQITAEDSDI